MPNQTHRQNERPELTSDNNVETGVEHTFPASDPVAATSSQGARAVPPGKMMDSAASSAGVHGAVTVQARFRDREAAKLALETLVREGPLDRRCAEIQPGDDAVTLRLQAPPKDAERLGSLLRQQGGAQI
jgi:hypothetical protein